MDPVLNHDGRYQPNAGYITDVMNRLAVDFIERKHDKPWSLFFAHKAVHPDAEQGADGRLRVAALGGYVVAERHRDLYRNAIFPRKPNMLTPAEVAKHKPAWAECLRLRESDEAKLVLEALHSFSQEEIRLRARMMAAVDEGVGDILAALERRGELDRTCILFLGDNGFFFGEHALGPERRFAYEEGIRAVSGALSAARATRIAAPRARDLPGHRADADKPRRWQAGPQIQGRSLLPLFAKGGARLRRGWRRSILCEYWAEQAMPWLVGMSYKAVRTDRYKYIHWVNRGKAGELDELYDLDADPFELHNRNRSRAHAAARTRLRAELRKLVGDALGI